MPANLSGNEGREATSLSPSCSNVFATLLMEKSIWNTEQIQPHQRGSASLCQPEVDIACYIQPVGCLCSGDSLAVHSALGPSCIYLHSLLVVPFILPEKTERQRSSILWKLQWLQ